MTIWHQRIEIIEGPVKPGKLAEVVLKCRLDLLQWPLYSVRVGASELDDNLFEGLIVRQPGRWLPHGVPDLLSVHPSEFGILSSFTLQLPLNAIYSLIHRCVRVRGVSNHVDQCIHEPEGVTIFRRPHRVDLLADVRWNLCLLSIGACGCIDSRVDS